MFFRNKKEKNKLEIQTTRYDDLTKFYFNYILDSIVKIGNLDNKNLRILDYGCGIGQLSKRIPNSNVTGYDIVKELTDIEDWKNGVFDYFVANQVFYSLTETEIRDVLTALRRINKKCMFRCMYIYSVYIYIHTVHTYICISLYRQLVVMETWEKEK